MKKRNYLLSLALTAILSLTCLTGCAGNEETAEVPVIEETASVETVEGGILCLKVNPEIAVHYDNEGLVTKVEARNDDGKAIIKEYTDYIGKETHLVVKDLVTAIGDAGYFVEEVEGISKQITIEIEVGSKIPNDNFIDEVVAEVKNYVDAKSWTSPIELENNTDYGITDYGTTDYNDAATNYDDHLTDYHDSNTNYDDHSTDYNDSNTDYNDSDYDD